jgi:hypothetical protein
MAAESPSLSTKPAVPVAKPPTPGLAVKAVPEQEIEVQTLSPWELHGWAYSVVAHAILLLILGLWYFGGKTSQVKTFDSRLFGNEAGVEDGMEALGGLDTPLKMPDLVQPTPTTDSTFTRLAPTDTSYPLPGFVGNTGNLGGGQGDGFGLAKFGNGGEEVRGVKVQVGDPQFTLLWNSVADIDLHVIEPGGKEIYWNDRKGNQGGELDVDNTDGYGPENIYWLKQNPDGSKDLGAGPPGEYRWYVKYYGGNRGVPVATSWKVRIKHEGRVEILNGRLTVPGSQSKIYTLTVSGPAQAAGKMPDFKP